jgi:GAF domain-containing protein
MDPRHGWCPHVVNRKLALPLHDVHASRTYSGNPVVDAIGITSYYGEPLIYPDTDIVLGTACVIDQQVHNIEESDALMQSVERAAAEAMANILAR